MAETGTVRPPTAATMRLDGGHPALELVNRIYGQFGGPVEHVVLATPADLELLSDEAELRRLHVCAGCCWLFLDHSRGSGRRWCSMADCGTEAKKRRYVQRRRERRRQEG